MTAEPEPSDPRIPEVKAAALRHAVPPGDWPAVGSVPVAVLVPVKNEETNIVACLRHVLWARQLVVVDSHSTDRTVPLAQAIGAEVYLFQYSKEGWPKKKNWALDSVPWRHEWVLIVDADEHITPELAREIAENSAPVSVALARRMLWRMLGAEHPMLAHRVDSRAMFIRGQSADAREGISAFLEKRPAEFPDRVSDGLPDVFPGWRAPAFE